MLCMTAVLCTSALSAHALYDVLVNTDFELAKGRQQHKTDDKRAHTISALADNSCIDHAD